ncbi:hypothetical protein, partial [Limosilactobacillus fermentum]|uniref:hypothetical protein n=1 Tax=Limosilactobacillus fermentum TaxID=1613 RepID=UPI0035584ADF
TGSWGKPPYSDWFLAISIIRGRLSLFQYPQGINLHKIFYTPDPRVRYSYSKQALHNIIINHPSQNPLTLAEALRGEQLFFNVSGCS